MHKTDYIQYIALDDNHVVRRDPMVAQERNLALRDLARSNLFRLKHWDEEGPYKVLLSISDCSLLLDIQTLTDQPVGEEMIAMRPFRKIIKDYFLICESFYKASKDGDRARVETLDMARRGLHNEGALKLKEYMDDRIEIDILTARRFFTLICVLHT